MTKKPKDNADVASGPVLPDERLREMLYFLKLCRYFDERMEALYRQGRLPGAIYSGRGQEGTHVGAAYALARFNQQHAATQCKLPRVRPARSEILE